jgi:predicted RNA-binding protein with EMAP domain
MAKDENIKAFAETLDELERGQLVRDLNEAVYNITHAVMETRKAGGLKLSLKFTPTGRGTVVVTADYDANIPEHDREVTTFFVTPGGGLVRDDPNQPNLPLGKVPDDRQAPLRVVPD